VGNQPDGWVAPPYYGAYPCTGYYFLDQDNPAVVTPNSCQIYNDGGLVHGEWQTLLDFRAGGLVSPAIRYYYGLATGGGGGAGFPLWLDGWEGGAVIPTTLELYIEAPTNITAYVFDWNNTQAWTWMYVGGGLLTILPAFGAGFAESFWMPHTNTGVVPLDVAGADMGFLRLRVTAPPVPGGVSGMVLYIGVTGARNPIAENWSVFGRQA